MSPNASTIPIPQRGAPYRSHTYNQRSLHVRAVSGSSKDLSFALEESNVLTQLSGISRLPIPSRYLRRVDDQYPPIMPATVVHDAHRKLACMKARAQHTRDPFLREFSEKEKPKKLDKTAYILNTPVPTLMGPERQRSIFVKDEELKCMLEDRVGTPHVNELQHDEDKTAELSAEELGLVGMLIAKEECLEEDDAARRVVLL
jgi:hypothetical protein